MDQDRDVTQVEVVLEAWRSYALDTILRFALALAFPAAFLVAFGWLIPVSLPMRTAVIAVYLVWLGIAFCRQVNSRWRASIFLLTSYVLVALQLWRTGMAGSGRIGLFVIPLYAVFFVGSRSGWIALVLGIFQYGLFVCLLQWGSLAQRMEVQENPTDIGFWLIQGVILLAGLVPILVLYNLLVSHYTQAIKVQSKTLAQLREEIAFRKTAQDALEDAARERRELEAEISRASEREQQRLAGELHDGLCQHLTVALLQCAAMENAPGPEKDLDGSRLRTHRTVLEESMGMAHDIAMGLWPLGFGADALVPALQRLARQTRETAGVSCELLEAGDTAIGAEQTALHLYRIAQEAVTNAIKHGRPQHITMTLRRTSWGITLQVEDDGCGIPEVRSPARGIGLCIMTNRAELLGGKLDLEKVPGGGTRIVCRVPRKQSGGGKIPGFPEPAETAALPSLDREDKDSHGA